MFCYIYKTFITTKDPLATSIGQRFNKPIKEKYITIPPSLRIQLLYFVRVQGLLKFYQPFFQLYQFLCLKLFLVLQDYLVRLTLLLEVLSCFQVPSTKAEKSDSSVLLKKYHVEKGQFETTAIRITPLETFYGESHLREQYLFCLTSY